MKFSIIIPALNEYEMLETNIPFIARKFPNSEILIIENGTDISPDFDYLENVRVLKSKKKGLGIALKYGLSFSRNTCAIFMPADLSYNASFIEHGAYLIDKGWDLVIGSKGFSEGNDIDRPLIRKVMSEVYNMIFNVIYSLNVKDITGVKAYNKDKIIPLLSRCSSDGIRFEVQLIHEMRKEKMRILEIPVRVKDLRKGAFIPW